MIKLTATFVALLFLTFLGIPQPAEADPPPIAAMEFGSDDVGPPDHVDKPRGHPSSHAGDSIRPRTVVISAGGSVMFKLPGGVHQVAIYAPGKKPSDFDPDGPTTGFLGCPGGLNGGRFIDDADMRVEVVDDPPCATGGTMVSSSAGTFDEPGKYLVICTFDSHFYNFDMYGWVIVK